MELTEGEHTLQVRGVVLDPTDTPLVDESPASRTWTIVGGAPPETTIARTPDAVSTTTSATFEFTSDQPNTTFFCSLDGLGFAVCESPLTYRNLLDGPHTFEVVGKNAAGLPDETPALYEWEVAAPPETTLADVPPVETPSTSATFTFGSNEVGTFECSLDGEPFAECVAPVNYPDVDLGTPPMSVGPHTFEVRAIDEAGNIDPSPARHTWTVKDATAPQTTITNVAPGSVIISFSGNDNADSADQLRYECSVDGATFSACVSPQTYDLPAGPHKFEVRAIDRAGNVDDTPAIYNWTVPDTIPPDTTITGQPADPTTSSSASFSFGGSDNLDTLAQLRYECRFDSDGASDWVACASPKVYSGLSAGAPYSLDIRAVDRAGNVDSTPATHTWTVVAPNCTTQTVSADADAWVDQASASNNSGSDTTLKLLSKGPSNNARALVRFTSLPAPPAGCELQSATLRLYASASAADRPLEAIRLASGWSETGVTWANQPATTGGVATTTSGLGYREWDVTSQVNAMTAASNHGFLIRDAAENAAGSEQQFHSREKPTDRPQLVYRYASSAGTAPNCGSEQRVGANADALIDQSAPAINKGSDASLKVLSKAPSLNVRSLVRFSLPAIPAGCAVESATLRLHAGAATIDRTIEAHQVGEGWSEGGVTWANQPATTGEPATTSSGAGIGYREWNVASQVAAMYTSANHGFLIRDAGENYTGPEQTYHSREKGDNRPELVITFAVPDTRAPKTTIDSGPGVTTISTNASFAFSANEPNATFECSLDGAVFAACATPRDYTGLAAGNHEFRVRAIDRSGNIDGSPAIYSWTIELPPDLAAPDTTITDKPSDPSPSRSPSLAFSGSDDSTPASLLTYECRLDGAAFTACSNPRSYSSLAVGPHTFEVRAIDLAGRVDPSPASYTWTIDATAPETTINNGPPSSTDSTSAQLTFSANEPGSTFECSLDNAPFAACTSPRDLTGLASGTHTFRVRAIDAAGNIDLTPASRTWSVTAVACASSVQTASSAADSWISESSPSSNYGTDSIVKVDSKAGSDARALFRFNLPAMPAGCEVVQAKLRLYAGSYKEGRTLEAVRLAASWTESLVTWGNQPATTGAVATTPSGSALGYREWIVTSQVGAMYTSGNFGFLIRDSSENGSGNEQGLHSREKIPNNVPELVITFD
jgi:hypothetical protein